MKIAVVLCSLATVAIAVPVYQENVFESSVSTQPLNTKRERKSALLDLTSGLLPEHGIEKIPIHSSKTSVPGTSVEVKSFRRPIIIKRKLGYHVYRDSDEEMAHAEPGEKCREQVKFKLCDHEPVSSSKNGIKSPTFKCMDSHKTDNEIENSIKMAKEAVEYLQRDLKRMEKFSAKIAQPHIEDIESNTGLHHDIEIAREAIEHIEQSFEPTNSEVNKVKELQIPKSQDEERLTRWREAIKNINKNFEIVKNIENAFKSDNHFSLLRSDSIKAVESGKPKFTNDNLENNDEAYNEDIILKSASNEVGIAQQTPIREDVGNGVFIFPIKNREENIQLHSDNLKSEIYSEDTSLRSEVSEKESTKYDDNASKESIEYAPKNSNSLSELPKYSIDDHVSDHYELLPKMSSSSSDTLEENLKIEEQKTIDKSELMMETALPQRENTNRLIQMKSVNEILENKKDQVKATTSNEENINEYEEQLFKFKNENSPLERLGLVPKSTIIEASENPEASEEENKYSDKHNNKIAEDNENKSKSDMRLSNDQLEETKQETPDNSVTKDQDNMQSPHLFSPKEKNVFSGEENMQNEHKTPHTIKENNQFYDSLKESGQEVKDETQNFKYTDEYENIKSSEVQGGQIGSRMVQNQELNKFTFLNDDSVINVVQKEPDLYKTVSEASNEQIFNYRDQSANQQSIEEEMSLSITQPKDGNDDRKWQYSKSVPELHSDPMISMPTENVHVTDNHYTHKSEESMRLSQTQNEKLRFNEYQEGAEYASTRADIEDNSDDATSRFFKSVPEVQLYPIASLHTDKIDIINDQQSDREEASMRSSESQNEKMQSYENQEVHEHLAMGLDIERPPEKSTWQLSKSVPELPYDPMVSMLTEKVDITENQNAHNGEASVRSSESQYKNLKLNEYQGKLEHASTRLDIENDANDATSQFLKSVPEIQLYPIVSLPMDKVDITDDQQVHKEESSMRSSESQNEKMQSNENLDVLQAPLTMELDSERRPEERTWQLSESVSELSYDPLVSMLTEKVDITDDLDSHKGEESMRSSESKNEKLQPNENQEMHEPLPIGLDIERYPEERTRQLSKSVPELLYDPMASMLTEKNDFTDVPDAHKGEASMRSSESQNAKLQSNENQDVLEPLPIELDSERRLLEGTWQLSKSVSDPSYDSLVSMQMEKVGITDESDAQKDEASIRSSESQNEKLQSNENQEVYEPLLTGLNIERHPEGRTWHFSKSVPELPYDQMVSMLSEKVDIAANPNIHEREASIRSSDSENGKMQLSESPEVHNSLPIGLNIEDNREDRTWSVSKSVPELHSDSMVLTPADKVDIINEQKSHREEASIRSAKGQNEKNQFDENPELQEPSSMGLDIEHLPEDSKLQHFKSVPGLPLNPMEKDDIKDDQQAHKVEVSMKSSEDQYEKLQLNKYQKEPEPASTRLDIENNSDDTKSQLFKSVPELQPNSIATLATDKIDITNEQESYREEASMRSSEGQNEKMQSSENQDVHESLSKGLDIERHPEVRTWQLSKSVPELPSDPLESMLTEKVDITHDPDTHKGEASMRSSETTSQFSKSVPEVLPDPMESLAMDKVDITNDQQSYSEEASMRSSESQNEKMLSSENQDVHESLSMGLDIERHPEERTWQLSKSVPELPYDPLVSMLTENVDITHDPDTHKGEASMRSSETTSQFSKSVPEVLPDPMASLAMDKVDITNDQQSYREEASMRSSESQNEKMQSSENQDVHESLSMGLDIERHPEEITWQLSKSVPELPSDPLVSMLTKKVDITHDPDTHKGEASIRSSESQNEKLQINEYYNEPEHASTRLDIENNSDDIKSQLLKSVPELQPQPIASLATDKGDITNGQKSYGEEASMRSSESQNEKMQSNINQEVHEPLMMRLDMTNHPEDRKWQVSKSVPELSYDPMASMSMDNVDITNEQHLLEKGNMRLSQTQNEKSEFDDSYGLHDYLPPKLGNENHPEYSASQFFKSSPELYMTRSNNHVNNGNFYFTEDARLSQNQNERQQIYFNHHLYEPLLSGLDIEKKYQDDSSEVLKSVQGHSENMLPLAANNLRFSYLENPTNEQTIMRLSQNRNENKELQYPSTSLGLSNEHMNKKDNEEHIKNNFMHLSVAQHQRLHENSNPMLRSSKGRQHLNPNFKSLPENTMLPPISQIEFSNGQNINMRINQQQSRDPEQMENLNLYNSMRWNNENQHQDLFPKSFKSITDFEHTLHKGNEFDNEQFIPLEVSEMRNTQEYRTRPQLFSDHTLDDTQSSRWFQTKQHNDHFANYYKSIPEVHEEYTNPHFRNNFNRVAVNPRLNDEDTFNTHDFPSSRARLHEHMQKYHQEKSSNIDSSMEPGMHIGMREPFAKSGTEFNNLHFNHPHGTARFGAGLPIAAVNPGPVGVFPTANAGGCGIPLLLSCSPSVVSGSLARSHIAGPIFKSGDENFKYHIKRDAKNFADIPDIKVQKTSLPYNHGTGTTNEI